MLLAADFVLDESLIRQLRELEATRAPASASRSAPPRAPDALAPRALRHSHPLGQDSTPPAQVLRAWRAMRPGEQVALDQVDSPVGCRASSWAGVSTPSATTSMPQAAGQADHRLDDRQPLAVVKLADEGCDRS